MLVGRMDLDPCYEDREELPATMLFLWKIVYKATQFNKPHCAASRLLWRTSIDSLNGLTASGVIVPVFSQIRTQGILTTTNIVILCESFESRALPPSRTDPK